MIKNLLPRLPEIGKIKIGCLGEERKGRQGNIYRLPHKLDHFIITFPERGNDGNFIPDLSLMEKIGQMTGQDPAHLTSLPCFLLYNEVEPNLYTTYCCYQGRTKVCQGDGKEAVTSTGEVRSCPCEKLDRGYKGPAICKPYCRLSVALAGTDKIGGVWVYRSCGWNTVQDLMGSLALLYQIAGGHIAGIPLSLDLVGRTATTPTGKIQKIYTVSLSYKGDLKALAQERQKSLVSMESSIPIETNINEEEAEEIAEEFYPEAGEEENTDKGKSAIELIQGKEKDKNAPAPEPEPEPIPTRVPDPEPEPIPTRAPDPEPETGPESEPEPAPDDFGPSPNDVAVEDLWGQP